MVFKIRSFRVASGFACFVCLFLSFFLPSFLSYPLPNPFPVFLPCVAASPIFPFSFHQVNSPNRFAIFRN